MVAGLFNAGFTLLWVLLFLLWVFLAYSCAKKRHWILFVLGFFFPLFWIIGALLPSL